MSTFKSRREVALEKLVLDRINLHTDRSTNRLLPEDQIAHTVVKLLLEDIVVIMKGIAAYEDAERETERKQWEAEQAERAKTP